MSFYVCSTFDEYDPKTGYYVVKIDCIQWDEDLLGSWSGQRYDTKEECYARSICSKSIGNINLSLGKSNNYCKIYIKSVSLISKSSSNITFNIELPEDYFNTYIEYALFDIDEVMLQNFQRLNINNNNTGFLNQSFIADVPIPSEAACVVAFRLVRPCETEISGGSYSGSIETGIGSSSGSSGSGSGTDTLDNAILFDPNSWANSVSSPFKTWLDIAADQWKALVKYDQNIIDNIRSSIDPSWNGCALVSYSEINDPSAGFVAACGPLSSINIIDNDPVDIKYNALTFQLIINTYYYNNPSIPLSSNDWIGVMRHELGHALGIGTLWNVTVPNFLDGGLYNNSISAYNNIIGEPSSSRLLVPVEDSGSIGTAGVHWENNYRGDTYANGNGFVYPSCNFDVMVGYITLGSPKNISNLSKQFLIDIGYASNGFPAVVISPSATIETSSQTTINNLCGCHDHCCHNENLGTINLVDNTFIPV